MILDTRRNGEWLEILKWMIGKIVKTIKGDTANVTGLIIYSFGEVLALADLLLFRSLWK
jgi:hypothetical protein